MAAINCLQIDAFAERPFAGNPAAVCLLDEPRDSRWMQAFAAEMNVSETAFVRPRGEDWELRWFTPTVEVELCGHATLASAHALWEQGIVDTGEPIRFHTRSGPLDCVRHGDLIEMDFPATPPDAAESSEELAEALGARPTWEGRSRFDAVVLVESEQALRALQPDFSQLRRLPLRGIIVTSAAEDDRLDFVSRFFAPGSGIDEDPVTGSAHCCLGPFWSERLDKTGMTAFQASARGGIVHVRVAGERVVLGGNAVTVLTGTLSDAATLAPQIHGGPTSTGD